MLKRKDLKFKLSKRHKEFAVIQFAQFMKPTDIVTAVMEKFKTELATDIEKYGEGEIRRYLSHNFWTLDPKNGKMSTEFKDIFEQHKEKYLTSYTDSYLRYPRNVVRELDALYEKCTEQLKNGDPDKARQLVPTMLKIVQTAQNTIDAIPFDELEKKDKLRDVRIAMHVADVFQIPDPLEEEDQEKLRELLETEASFDEIREFVERLRCQGLDIFAVHPVKINHKGEPGTVTFIRGRIFECLMPADIAAQEEEEELAKLKQSRLKTFHQPPQ